MNKPADISQQIKKYLNGELDADAMHELERRAQDDPFLMDALEGYEKIPVDEDAGLNELQSRLQQRVERREAHVVPWRMLGIAASILLLLGVGLFRYTERSLPSLVMEKVVMQKPPANTPQSVQKKASTVEDSSAFAANMDKVITNHSKRIAVNRKRKEIISSNVVADAKVAAVPPAVSELQASNANAVFKSENTTPLNEMVVMDYTAKKKANALLKELPIGTSADSVARFPDKQAAGMMKIDTSKFKGNVVRIKGTDLASVNNDLSGYNSASALNQYKNTPQRFGGVVPKQEYSEMAVLHSLSITSNNTVKAYTAKGLRAGGSITPFNPVILHGRMVKGMVKASGEPVTYATVKIKGTNISTLTDAGGRFTLYTVPDSAILQVTADGDVLRETKVTRHDLQVISIRAENDNDFSENMQPRPSTGWSDFYGYLHQNAVSPNGRKGTVKLSFKVNADNSLSDFKILKGISTQTNNAAIKLVKDGPEWYSPSDDKAQTVTISIKFHIRKK